jgi:hypothetical protein
MSKGLKRNDKTINVSIIMETKVLSSIDKKSAFQNVFEI